MVIMLEPSSYIFLFKDILLNNECQAKSSAL